MHTQFEKEVRKAKSDQQLTNLTLAVIIEVLLDIRDILLDDHPAAYQEPPDFSGATPGDR